jgi:hypothetical protein
MKAIYTRFRIAFYTFGLGLACVWLYQGLLISAEHIEIQLPKVESETVITVFPMNRYSSLGGSSGPDGPTVILRRIEESDTTKLMFRFENHLEEPIFFPSVKNRAGAVPYFLECLDSSNGPISVIPTDFDFGPVPARLATGAGTTFAVENPGSYGACGIYVPYEITESAAQNLVPQGTYESDNWYAFRDRTSHWKGEVFELRPHTR